MTDGRYPSATAFFLARQRGILMPSLALFFHSRPGALPGSRDIPPFLSVRLRSDHTAQPMPVAKECFNCWPETALHNRVDPRQALALKLRRDTSPVFFRL